MDTLARLAGVSKIYPRVHRPGDEGCGVARLQQFYGLRQRFQDIARVGGLQAAWCGRSAQFDWTAAQFPAVHFCAGFP